FGDYDKSSLTFWKNKGVPVMLYINGASIKYRPDLTLASGYNALTVLNQYKDIPPGSDSTAYSNWAMNTARTFKGLTHLWGRNTSSVLPSTYTITAAGGTNLSAGQNKLR